MLRGCDVQGGDGFVEVLGWYDLVRMAFGTKPLLVDLVGDGDQMRAWGGGWVYAEAVEEHDCEDHAADGLGQSQSALAVFGRGFELPLEKDLGDGIQLLPTAVSVQYPRCCGQKCLVG